MGHANGFLFGLAPSGVYPATRVTTGAVRFYRTFSPLPVLSDVGGMFSVALSVGSRRPGVTWHFALWSPDFPLQKNFYSDCLTSYENYSIIQLKERETIAVRNSGTHPIQPFSALF
jgi:hypothetical protein